MNTFQLVIVAYNKIIYNDRAIYCGVTTKDGSMGFEAKHAPVLGVLKDNSVIHYKNPEGDESTVQVESGMFSFNNNECVITVGIV